MNIDGQPVYETIDFLDDNSSEAIGKIDDLEKYWDKYFDMIGNNTVRKQLLDQAAALGFNFPVLIHPTTYISLSAVIEAETVEEPKTVVNANMVIPRGCIISVGAIVDHDVIINEFVHVNAGAIVKAGARVESGRKLKGGEVVLGYGTAQYKPDELWMKGHMFVGNISPIQSVETVVRAAEILKGEPFKFHIVGGGTNLERLKGLAKNFNNVVFYGRRPLEEMPKFYAMADAMLVALAADPVLSLTLPGKVQAYIINGESPLVVSEAECGICGDTEDAVALAEIYVRLF